MISFAELPIELYTVYVISVSPELRKVPQVQALEMPLKFIGEQNLTTYINKCTIASSDSFLHVALTYVYPSHFVFPMYWPSLFFSVQKAFASSSLKLPFTIGTIGKC